MPRLINVICDRALLGAYAKESRRINARLIRQAAAEVHGELASSPWTRRLAVAAGVIGVAVIGATAWSIMQQQPPVEPVRAAVEQAPADPAPAPAPVVEVVTKPPVEEIVEEPVLPSLQEQLQLAEQLTGTEFAMATLFETWGLEYTTGGRTACDQARDSGLNCLFQRGSWTGLRQMDRPAVLTLVDDDGNRHQVVLTAIIDNSAELSIGGVRVTHPASEIINAWFGEFMLLWRPPTEAAAALGPGSSGPAVAWLRNSLAAIDQRYASSDAGGDLFDAELEQIVRLFQRDHRLDIDGLAGQQTQIIINSLLAVEGTPRLSTPRLAQD